MSNVSASAAAHGLFGPEGQAIVAAFIRQQPPPLLAFDFDGTLAPIVARPDDARIPPATAALLQALAARLPLAIVTGRAVADVRGRLGFTPRDVVGNHGAEDAGRPGLAQALTRALDVLRARLALHAGALAAAGVTVEDKGPSLALHYRLAPDSALALAAVDQVLQPPLPGVHVFGGKMVVNVAPDGAPDKAQAVQALAARLGTTSAFFAGDDINDEPVFAAAPPHWLTVRVGSVGAADPPSLARFHVAGPHEMALLLQRMLLLLPAPPR